MPHEEVLKERARQMRREPTEPEKRLWRHLSNSQLGGFKFRRQHRFDFRIFDFFCPAVGLVVEVDGHTHDTEVDTKRDAKLPFKVVRVTNEDVMRNVEGVLELILSTAQELPPRWPDGRPHPNPSPEGEGL